MNAFRPCRSGIEPLEPRTLLAAAADEYIAPASAPVQYQPHAIHFDGPYAAELDDAPNPFLDYRLNVSFLHESGAWYPNVPGFFAGDGAGAGAGSTWQVMFTPPLAGKWNYIASYRQGDDVAVSLDPTAGASAAFDGAVGVLHVEPADPSAPGFLAKGMLRYDGFYPRFDNGEYFVKAGSNGPENFLGYSGFDNTPYARHTYAAHVQDWQSGDPDWGNGAGRAIIGAVNYLSSHGVNSLFFMPMNIGGDAKDTWPFAGAVNRDGRPENDNLHYDLSKLAQWETVFSHAQRKGVKLHFVFNEAEASNKRELDDATLGVERKLFYREMVARFGHHNAVQWNVSEEYDHYRLPLDPAVVAEWAGYIQAVDPYDHPITVHNFDDTDITFTPFLGDSRFSGTSFQYANGVAGRGDEVEEWRVLSEQAGRPKHISMDELRATTTSNLADQRRDLLWPTLLSGGSIEFYFGAGTDGIELDMNDFRPYENLWRWSGIALDFIHTLPFWRMEPADALLDGETTSSSSGDGQVFLAAGEVYVVYLPVASSTGTLDLRAEAGHSFEMSWLNPRTGQATFARTVGGGGAVALGPPPGSASDDWVAILRNNSIVTGPPAMPGNPQLIDVTHDSATIGWVDPSANEANFVIESWDGSRYVDVAVVPRNVTTWTVTGLSPMVDYALRIRSQNSLGAAVNKQLIEFTTREPPAGQEAAATTALAFGAGSEPLATGNTHSGEDEEDDLTDRRARRAAKDDLLDAGRQRKLRR